MTSDAILMTYILNPRSKVAHIAPSIERCNGDQIKGRRESPILPADYRLCRHCQKRLP